VKKLLAFNILLHFHAFIMMKPRHFKEVEAFYNMRKLCKGNIIYNSSIFSPKQSEWAKSLKKPVE